MSNEFEALGDRLPPQNIEAEEAILGGILLDPEAIARVIDLLQPEMFYVAAHQEIFRACLQLHGQSNPTDMMSVTTWLSDRDLLEKLGGQSKIVQLCDRTVSAINVDYYAQLVAEKYMRRRLAEAGRETVNVSYDTSVDLPQALDLAEQKIFAVTQSRTQQGLTLAGDILTKTFYELESRFNSLGSTGTNLPGLATGFYDLDSMTQGFQRSDLIIVAGRPSMGKCLSADSEIVLADGSMATIADLYRRHEAKLLTLNSSWQFAFTQPSAYVDDGIKPVFRVTTRLGRCVESTLTHPYLTINGWRSLSELKAGHKIAVPRKLPVFGEFRLRECEVKLLAYLLGDGCLTDTTPELKFVPEIVFKLERSQLALFLNRLFATDGWACFLASGQSQLGYASVSEKLVRQIQHLLLRFGIIARLKERSVKYKSQRNQAWQLDITDAISIKTFIAEIGIFGKEAALEKVEQALSIRKYQTNCDLIPVEIWEPLTVAKDQESWKSLARRAGIKGESNIHVGKRAPTRNRLSVLATALENEELQNLANSDIYWDEIVSIESLGMKQVYDLTIPETHNFVANDICVHNTAFSLAVAYKMAGLHKLPIVVFSLEMSKEQLVYRLLANASRIDSSRLRSGNISENEWSSIANAISTLSELPMYIDDAPNPSITELRSKARRLQSEKGGALGLILIDYLQLMEGSGSDNRVQELSRITRSLKGLARELQVPVIALSQLSRGVEARTNKRPMLSDLRESGCVSGDTLITLADDSSQVPIRDLVGKSDFAVWALNETTLKLERAIVSDAFDTGVKPVYTLTTKLGRTVKATGNHKFLTIHGWKRLDELQKDEQIALPQHIHSDIYWDEILSIEANGEEAVYDLTVEKLHNFIGNNIVLHNSIEQDADLVINLYRDEYYNPDSPDRGIAEVIIAKHRNGPVGTVKLLFEPRFTWFENLTTATK